MRQLSHSYRHWILEEIGKRIMVKRILMVWVVVFLFTPFSSLAQEIDQALLEKTVKTATSNIFPSNDAHVLYEPLTQEIYITFTTPSGYKESTDDPYYRWRRNQWAVLQEFKLSRIPVEKVSVETNDINGERLIRYTHTATHSDKYGDIHENRLWLRTARGKQKRLGEDQWEKIK